MKYIRTLLDKFYNFINPFDEFEPRGDILLNGDDYDVIIRSNNKEVLKAYNGKLYIYGTEVIL